MMKIGSILIIIGAVLTSINMKIVEVSVNYSNCGKIDEKCYVDFDINEEMNPPIFLFYELENFYQNHRRYVRSKSLTQLSGENIGEDSLTKNCDPILYVKDLKKKTNNKGELMDLNAPANPCGLIANSYFNGFFFIEN